MSSNGTVPDKRFHLGPRVRIAIITEARPLYETAIHTARELWELLHDEVATWDRERFVVILLTSGNKVIGVDEVAVGSGNVTVISPREVIKSIILSNAAGVLCLHNHPDTHPKPTLDDERVTEQIRQTCDLLGVCFLDHVIFGEESFYSFVDNDKLAPS